jgi:cyclomaltodextrinase / maltogenic alpha-amylase / neopullulanase
MTVPYWVEDAVFYKIFPDRFANGDPEHIMESTLPWDAAPTLYGFQGGDLRGVIRKLDYLLDLGINAIYFNPIFQATSTHRYNTSDYFKIDSKLGDLRDFQALLSVAHQNGVRVILDGVFNHCGRGFFAFNDLLENQEHSPYKDWFHVNRFPVRAYSPGEAEDFQAWWGYKNLPKLNTANPAVRKYILNVARYWIDLGIDGWRLDVPNEINDDDFWADYRQVVKISNPDAYLLGEIWDGDPHWAGERKFDGLMQYPVREGIIKWLTGQETTLQFAERVEKLLTQYPRENVYAMYLLLGSHDTERILTLLNNDVAKVKLAFLFQFAYPGAPAVYYGDEIGMEGGKDPGCRRTFYWDPTCWKQDLRHWVKQLIQLRKSHPALRRGEYKRIWMDAARSCYAFGRTLGESKVMVVMNASSTRRQVRIPVSGLDWQDGKIVHNLLDSGEYIVSGEFLPVSLPAWSGLMLV